MCVFTNKQTINEEQYVDTTSASAIKDQSILTNNQLQFRENEIRFRVMNLLLLHDSLKCGKKGLLDQIQDK